MRRASRFKIPRKEGRTLRTHVLVTHPLIEHGLDLLTAHYDVEVAGGLSSAQLCEWASLAECAALIPLLSVRIDEAVLQRAPRLQVIANYAAGYDNIDLAAATRRGIWVTNTPGVLTEATADLTWAALLALVRQVVRGDALVRRGEFVGWGPTLLLGVELAGKTLGVVGFGQIGRAVARRAAGFAMPVLYYDERCAEPEVDLGPNRARCAASLEELLQQADIVTLHTPLTPQTHHLLDAQRLSLLRPTAYLINTSRGPVVDEAALVAHLRAGRLAGAALDVYEREPALCPGLAELEQVVLLPHLGSATRESRGAMAKLAAENVHAVLQGRVPPTPVNQPLMRAP